MLLRISPRITKKAADRSGAAAAVQRKISSKTRKMAKLTVGAELSDREDVIED
jgi:hypothetical protein